LLIAEKVCQRRGVRGTKIQKKRKKKKKKKRKKKEKKGKKRTATAPKLQTAMQTAGSTARLRANWTV
jgi:hypothetical protein